MPDPSALAFGSPRIRASAVHDLQTRGFWLLAALFSLPFDYLADFFADRACDARQNQTFLENAYV